MRTLFIICFVVALVLFYSVSGLTQGGLQTDSNQLKNRRINPT